MMFFEYAYIWRVASVHIMLGSKIERYQRRCCSLVINFLLRRTVKSPR